jgi:hypothetical protein
MEANADKWPAKITNRFLRICTGVSRKLIWKRNIQIRGSPTAGATLDMLSMVLYPSSDMTGRLHSEDKVHKKRSHGRIVRRAENMKTDMVCDDSANNKIRQ